MDRFRVLQFGNTDLVGRRFNGHDLHLHMRNLGYESHHLVWKKKSEDAHTSELTFPFKQQITPVVKNLEEDLSIQTLLHPAPLAVAVNKHFARADLVHYQILHTEWFSLLGLPHLTAKKPSVLTLHDPWAATGHCVYPRDCNRWQTGCGSCPDLDVIWSMKRDNTAFMWKTKKQIFEKCNLELIVASKFMLELAKASPLLSRFKHHLVPFGVKLDKYRRENIEEKRKALGIYPGNTVLFLRASASPFKGVPFVRDALNRLTTGKPLTILTVDAKELFADYLGKHQLIDLGWVDDEDKIIDAYHCADIFLMPSTAEAFGVMAIEAMACGKPSIVFDGTSLPEVTFAPEAAISVPMGDSAALAEAMDSLIDDAAMRKKMGERGRELADMHYGWDKHAQRVLAVYQDVLSRREVQSARS